MARNCRSGLFTEPFPRHSHLAKFRVLLRTLLSFKTELSSPRCITPSYVADLIKQKWQGLPLLINPRADNLPWCPEQGSSPEGPKTIPYVSSHVITRRLRYLRKLIQVSPTHVLRNYKYPERHTWHRPRQLPERMITRPTWRPSQGSLYKGRDFALTEVCHLTLIHDFWIYLSSNTLGIMVAGSVSTKIIHVCQIIEWARVSN